MALQFEVAAVPEGLEAHYKQAGDKFVLDVDGVVPQAQFQTAQSKAAELETKISEFRTNNIALKQQLETAGKQTVDVEALLEPRIGEMKTNYTKQIEELSKTVTLQAQHLEKVVLSDSVKEAALKYGVLETALPDVLNRARETFVVKDGTAVSKDKSLDKEGKPLSVQSWLVNLTESASHLFAPSRGSGAQRSVSGVNQPVRMSPVDKIAAGLAKR